MKKRSRRSVGSFGTGAFSTHSATQTLASTKNFSTQSLQNSRKPRDVRPMPYMKPTASSSIRQKIKSEERRYHLPTQEVPQSRDSAVLRAKVERDRETVDPETDREKCRKIISTLRKKYQTQPMTQAFLAWDRDRSGSLNRAEVGRVLDLLGFEPSSGTTELFYNTMCHHGDGAVNYRAFTNLLGANSIITSPSKLKPENRAYVSDEGEFLDPVDRIRHQRSGNLFTTSKTEDELANNLLNKLKGRYGNLSKPLDMLRKWDVDRDGVVSRSDCETVLKAMNVNLNPTEMNSFYSLLKHNNTEQTEVTFKDMIKTVLEPEPISPEFQRPQKRISVDQSCNPQLDRALFLLREKSEMKYRSNPVRKLFQSISLNKSEVSKREFKERIQQVCPELSREDAECVAAAAGNSDDGTVGFGTLTALFKRKGVDNLPVSRDPRRAPERSNLLRSNPKQERGQTLRGYNILQPDPTTALFCSEKSRFYRKT